MKKLRIVLMSTFIGMLILLAGCGRATINMSDYVNVKFEGLNGQGTAKITTNGFEGAVEKIVYGKNGAGTLEGIDMVIEITDSVSLTLDKNSELSNGDTVTVNIEVDEETAEEHKINFTGTQPMTFTVSGLDEPIMLDPFDPEFFNNGEEESVKISCSGVSPEANVSVINDLPKDNPASNIHYTAEPNDNIEKGQEVKIIANATPDLTEAGYMLSAEETTFKCDEVNVHLTNLDEISDEVMQKLITNCESIAEDDNKLGLGTLVLTVDGGIKPGNETGKYSNINISKVYLLTLKDPNSTPEELGSSTFAPTMYRNGLVFSFTCDLAKTKNICGFCYTADVDVMTDGTLSSTSFRCNNLFYETEDYFKMKAIDIHLENYNIEEKDI